MHAETDGAQAEEPKSEPAPQPDCFNPSYVRLVEVEEKETGETVRRDCYDPDGGAAEMGDVMRLKDGELWLRVISWAREKARSTEVTLQWERVGLSKEEVGRIGVYTWPGGKPVRVFEDQGLRGERPQGGE